MTSAYADKAIEGYQLRHKEWGVFQGEFLGLGFWHPMSEQPEQGFYRFMSQEETQGYLDFLCSDRCANPHKADEFTVEPFDAETSLRMQTGMTAESITETSQSTAFPFECDEDYEREFYNGTLLDGWHGGDSNERFTVLNDAIVRACERSTNGDVWGVYQVGKLYDEDGFRNSDRIVAVVFEQNAYLFEPEPKECKKVEIITLG